MQTKTIELLISIITLIAIVFIGYIGIKTVDKIDAKPPQTTPEKAEITAQVPEVKPKGGNVPFLYSFENGEQQIMGKGSYYSYRIGTFNSKNEDVCAVREKNAKRHFKIKILNLDNFKTASCRITDYGPNAKIHPDRVVDMSPKVFKQLSNDGSLKSGILKNIVLIIE